MTMKFVGTWASEMHQCKSGDPGGDKFFQVFFFQVSGVRKCQRYDQFLIWNFRTQKMILINNLKRNVKVSPVWSDCKKRATSLSIVEFNEANLQPPICNSNKIILMILCALFFKWFRLLQPPSAPRAPWRRKAKMRRAADAKRKTPNSSSWGKCSPYRRPSPLNWIKPPLYDCPLLIWKWGKFSRMVRKTKIIQISYIKWSFIFRRFRGRLGGISGSSKP